MINKKTIVFIGKEDNCVYGNCIKDSLSADSIYATLILSSREFSNYYKNVISDRLSKKSSLFKDGKEFINNKFYYSIDKIIPEDTVFYSKKTRYNNMLNMFIRFNPDVVVITDYSVILPCLATIKRLNVITKTIVISDEFVFDKRLINKGVDLYIIPNHEAKTILEENGIPEDKIKMLNIFTKKEFYISPPKEETAKVLGINPEIPTVLIARGQYADNYLKKLETSSLSSSFGFISIIDDDNIDLNTAFSCADIIITQPNTKTIIKGLVKNKIVFTYCPNNSLEKRNAEYLECDIAVNINDYKDLEDQLKNYLEDKNIFNDKLELSAHFSHNPINEIIELIKGVIL